MARAEECTKTCSTTTIRNRQWRPPHRNFPGATGTPYGAFMVIWVRTYRLEALTVASLVLVASLPRSLIPGATSDWAPWFLIEAASPQMWIGSEETLVPAPLGVLRVMVLAVFVLVAVRRVQGRTSDTAGLGYRVAVCAGAGALAAGAAAILTAPVVIPILVENYDRLSAGDALRYWLVSPALCFGLVAGGLAGLLHRLRTATSLRAVVGRPASVFPMHFPMHRRNVSMPSLGDGPRRRSVFGPPPVTTAGPWAAPDVTRTLCAGVRVDRAFRRQVLRLLTESSRRAIIASPGVNLCLVLRHAEDTERREFRRAIQRSVLAAAAFYLGVVGAAAGGGDPLIWGRLLITVASVSAVIEFRHHRNAEGDLAALHDAQVGPDVTRVPVPVSTPSPSLREWLEAITLAQQGNVTVSAGSGPLQGLGEEVDAWMLSVSLKPADHPVLPEFALSGAPSRPVQAFEDAELEKAVQDRLGRLQPPGHRGGSPEVQLEERLFANGASLRDVEALLPAVGGPLRLRLAPEELAAIDGAAPPAVRRYLVCRISSWNGHIGTTTLLRIRTEGELLQVECVKMMERPLRARYRSIVTGGTGDVRPGTGFMVLRAAQTALTGIVAGPFQVLGRAADDWRRQGIRVAEAKHAPAERDFDYGGLGSVRALASAGEGMTYYQHVDASAQLQLVDKTVLLTVVDFLEERGFDTSELRNYQTRLLNQGIIQVGGVSTVGNQAVGAGATVAASRASVAAAPGGAT